MRVVSLRNRVLPSPTLAVWNLAAALLLAAGSLPLQAQGSIAYYFPHLAVGENWQTTITYINYSSQKVTCQTDFISDHGSPLLVSFPGRGMVSSRTDVLPPGGAVHQETNVELSAPLTPGWAKAVCSAPVKASLLFRQFKGGVPVAEAGINAAATPTTRFVTLAEQQEGKDGTGVAYANPSDTAALVTFIARDAAGQTLASVDKTLLPGEHGAQNMTNLFDLGSFTGSLEVTSKVPIVSLSLNFEAAPVFSSLPPGAPDASGQGLTTYYFPHLAVGASWQTTITYINFSSKEVTCRTDFISDHGSPLLVSFPGGGMVSSRTDILPPGGSVHQETNIDLSAPLAAGWAQATCSAPVKASLLFRQRNSSGVPVAEAGINAAPVPATRFVTFAEQQEGKRGTGVAYGNPSTTAAQVTLTARDAGGQTLASVDKNLLPGEHGAQNMANLFGLGSFTGSLEVTSKVPIVSLSLNFEAAPVFSSLPPGEVPVVPLQDAGKMYWTAPATTKHRPKIQRANLDGTQVEDLVTLITGIDVPLGLALDLGAGKMYWTNYDKIQRANLDGSEVEDLITTGLEHPFDIALDPGGGKMYWTDRGSISGGRKIQRANLDGTQVEDLVTWTGFNPIVHSPTGLALDLDRGKMYWLDDGFGGGRHNIQRANLDGTQVEDLTRGEGLITPTFLALDPGGGKMYWTDRGTTKFRAKIQRANLDGTQVEDLLTLQLGLSTGPVGLALDLDAGKMYWTHRDPDKIQRANLDGSEVEDLITTGLGHPVDLALDLGN